MNNPQQFHKDLEAVKKQLDRDTYDEIGALGAEGLNKRIADATQVISDTKQELEATPEYQKIVEDKKLLEAGLREVKKRQSAVIKLCLMLRS